MVNVVNRKFEKFFQDLFLNNSEKLVKTSQENLSLILAPLKENIEKFEKEVQEAYSIEARERFALAKEITRMTEMNQKITDETHKLTQALKGDVKRQGVWGELILERILEASGLREGYNYILQGKGLELKDEEQRHQKPDVVIMLPENRQIVIDSKVSLKSYEKVLSSESEEDKKSYQKSFLTSLQNHISDLSKKSYHYSEKLHSPDFTLMLFPTEELFTGS